MNKQFFCFCLLFIISKNIFGQETTSSVYKKDSTTSFLYSTQMKILFLIEGYYFHDKVTEVKQLDSIKFVPAIVTETLFIRKNLTVYFIKDIYAIAYDSETKNIYRLKGFIENDYFWLKRENQGVNFS